MIPLNASPYCKNVLFDEKNRISKVFGTTALLTAANNAFATNPIYNTYNYIEQDGAENLIIQAVSAIGGMQLWVLRVDGTAITIITPSGVTLTTDRQCHFVTHKGHLYMTDGQNHLMRWSGATTTPTEGWVKYHTKSFEKFRFLCAGSPRYPRLYAAHSWNNPIRVIYTEPNEDAFYKYYGGGVDPATGAPYIGGLAFMDFPTSDGTPVTGIAWYQDSLIVTKPNHIFRVYGDPSYGVTISCVAHGLGCVAHESLAIRDDNTLIFMAKDGIWTGGSDLVYASAEDGSIKTKMEFRRVTTEIDDYWRTYVTVPDLATGKTITKAGATDLATFSLTRAIVRTPPITTSLPVVINFNFGATETTAVSFTTAADAWVALSSYIDLLNIEDVYCAQTFTFDAGMSSGVVSKVRLWLKKTGTMTSSIKLNVYMCGTTEDEYGNLRADRGKTFAEGQIVGTSVTNSTTGEVIDCTMAYWDYPQSMFAVSSTVPKTAIVVIPEGDDASNYMSWGYVAAGGYTGGQMQNADETTPGDQSTKDYYFIVYTKTFYANAVVETSAFYADSDIVSWINVSPEFDKKTLGGYTRITKLKKIEYALGGNDPTPSWGSYTTVTSSGGLTGSDRNIKFKFTLSRSTAASLLYQDSFTLVNVKTTYSTQTKTNTLVKGIIWEGRYLLACNIADSGG